MNITYELSNLTGGQKTPLYVRLNGSAVPCRAYVVIDCATRTVCTRIAIPSETPVPLRYGVWQEVPVSPYIDGTELARYLTSEPARTLCEQIIDGCKLVRDTKLNIMGMLTPSAECAKNDLEDQLKRIPTIEAADLE